MASVKLRLRAGNTADKQQTLVFQIIHNRKKRTEATGIKMFFDDFDTIKEQILTTGTSKFTSGEIRAMYRRISIRHKELLSVVHKLESGWSDYSIDDIMMNSDNRFHKYLLQHIKEQIRITQLKERYGTSAAYKSTLSSLDRFLKGKDVTISSINKKFVKSYYDYLQERGITQNTISYYLRNLRTLYNMANDEDSIDINEYPFRKIKVSPQKTTKRALSQDELLRVLKWEFNARESHLALARDVFLFSFYTRGMSFVDIVFLKKSNISGIHITYKRKKSKQLLHISITPQLQELIDRYSNDSEYILPILDNKSSKLLYTQYKLAFNRINRSLKILGERLSISSKLTSYCARHSWATRAKELGTPVGIISEGLGHTSEHITNIYLKELDYSVIDKINAKIVKL